MDKNRIEHFKSFVGYGDMNPGSAIFIESYDASIDTFTIQYSWGAPDNIETHTVTPEELFEKFLCGYGRIKKGDFFNMDYRLPEFGKKSIVLQMPAGSAFARTLDDKIIITGDFGDTISFEICQGAAKNLGEPESRCILTLGRSYDRIKREYGSISLDNNIGHETH